MAGYSTRRVAELVGLSPAQVRAYARRGLVAAARDVSGRYRFSFQDIVLIRAAKTLRDAGIDAHAIWRGLRTLKRRLPSGNPLSELRIVATGDRVSVRDNHALWQVDTGQIQIDFNVKDVVRQIAPLVREAVSEARRQNDVGADDWYNLGVDLELVGDIVEAEYAYRRALALDAGHSDALVNLGRLEHAAGRFQEAEQMYRAALRHTPCHVLAIFNLGLVLEELRQGPAAIDAYRRAIDIDAGFADAHYNLARLYEEHGDRRAALRHLARYRALAGERKV
ncbi:MAG: tetratricopeptide repeat protein [Gammaproteobacteria bacterium]|nr:tetratricopeptide repeat protein [Gammaproteobacteria bacterium]